MQPKPLIPLVVLLAGLTSVATAAPEVREFTSADGTRKISASVLNATQTPKGVTADLLRADTKQRLTVSEAAFTAEDQAYLKKQAEIFHAARALQISPALLQSKSGKPSEEQGRRIGKTEAHYALECRNTGQTSVEGVDLEYKIFVKRERRLTPTKGEKKVEIVKGTMKLPELAMKGSHLAKTDAIELISDRPNLGGKGCSLSGG